MKKATSFLSLYAFFLVLALLAACQNPVSGDTSKDKNETKKSHTITFNENGGTGTMENQTIVSGKSAPLTANAFTREGYAFSGWATSANATNAIYTDCANYKMGNADVTLYAVWTGDYLTITFKANGGLGTMEKQTIVSGKSAPLTANAFTHSGYTFDGWSLNANAKIGEYTDKEIYKIGSSNVVFYAIWKAVSTGNMTLDTLHSGGYIAMIDIPTVVDGSYTQTAISRYFSSPSSFIHNISGFNLGKYEVTYELWYTVFQWALSHGYSFQNLGCEGYLGTAGATPTSAKLEPVTKVSWRDCIVWCNAYSEMAGKACVYFSDYYMMTPIKSSVDGSYTISINTTAGSYDNPYVNASSNGYRLPTEGEWQYAASCKATYPWNHYSGADAAWNVTTGGSDIDGDGDTQYSIEVAWLLSNSSSVTHSVGEKAGNMYGLYDMSGNVSEYCYDWFTKTLPVTTQTDYKGPKYDSAYPWHVCRGSSLEGESDGVVGYRGLSSPINEFNYNGFRVCCTR